MLRKTIFFISLFLASQHQFVLSLSFGLIVLIVRSYENVQLRLFPAAVIVVNDLKKTSGS